MGEPKQSPVPEEVIDAEIVQDDKEYDFPAAVRMIMKGKRVTSKAWEDDETYGFLNKGYLMLHRSDTGKDHQWIVNEGDLVAVDWIVL